MAPDNGLVQVAGPKGGWSTGLFEIKRPLPLCLYAWCLPCCATASARTEFDESDFIFNLLTINPTMARSIIRAGYSIEGNFIEDMILPVFLQPCVVAQMLEEVRKRGPAHKTKDGKQEWKSGLFEFELMTWLYAYCFLPCAVAESRRRFDDSNYILNCLCSNVALNRSIIRQGYELEGNCMMDLILSCLLPLCVTTQVMLETKKRGRVAGAKPASASMH